MPGAWAVGGLGHPGARFRSMVSPEIFLGAPSLNKNLMSGNRKRRPAGFDHPATSPEPGPGFPPDRESGSQTSKGIPASSAQPAVSNAGWMPTLRASQP